MRARAELLWFPGKGKGALRQAQGTSPGRAAAARCSPLQLRVAGLVVALRDEESKAEMHACEAREA